MNNYHQVIVYGTLREGCYNRKAHIPKAVSLGTILLPGYKLYRKIRNKRIADLFPFAIKTGFKSHKIRVELLLLTTDELRKVQKLENQYITIPVMIEGYQNPFLMWIQDEKYLKSLGDMACHIQGNWIPYSRRNGIM